MPQGNNVLVPRAHGSVFGGTIAQRLPRPRLSCTVVLNILTAHGLLSFSLPQGTNVIDFCAHGSMLSGFMAQWLS